MDAAAMAPFTVSEAFSLLSFGINPQEFYVTMESDKYICVREKTPYDCVVIIDMNMANQPVRKYMAADSAIMNPTSKLLAVKVQLPGTTQDHLQLLNIEKEQVKSHHMHEKIVFLKWLTPKMLGLVTQTSVYHWSTEDGSNPVKKFDRTANLIYNQIIDYRCDPAEKWLALIGIAPGSAESPHVVKGNMLLFSVDQQRTQEFEAHAASFVSFTFPGNEKPSTLLCYSSRIATAGHITSRLYVIELGALLGKPGFQKKEADLFFPQDFADDLPVSMQISDKYGLIYVITTLGLLFVYDLETATPIYWNQISGDAIIATSKASLGGGFYVVNCRGQVLLATVNEAAIVPFVSGQVNNIELAVNLAKRGNLPGAENLVVQQFHNLFSQRRYNEAAGLAAESPHGLLRTPDTIARFQSVHVWRGQTPPLLLYFEALLGRGKLDADESIKLSQLLVDQNKEDLLEIWLDEDKLECSQDLGDLLESVNYDLAQKVYAKAEGTSETVDDICEQMSHFKFDKNDPSFETKAMAAVENELSSIIGMKDLKLQLRNWAKVMILNEKRRSLGINLGKRKLPHIAFLGNPGTGKTMVARILGRILNMVGILRTDHVIEVQRTDLIGEYIGQTGPKTKAKIEEAEGGILFVDEAYRLVVESEKSQDYGKEALEEIMSVMEDGNIVVIFAGYAEAMKKVIASNEGFTRRVSKFFTFTDYDPMDLAEIVHVKMTKQSEKSHFYGFKLDPSCSLEAIKDLISRETTEKQRNKLNGGLADLMLTNALEKLDLRLDFGTTDKNELLTITMQDLENGIRSLAQCQGGEGKEETHAAYQSASDTPNHGNGGRTQQEENHIAYQSAFNTTNYGYEGRTQQDHHIAYQSAFDTRNFGNEGRTQQEDHHIASQSAFYNPHSVDEGRTQHNGHNIAYQSPFNNPNYGDERRAQHNDYNITYQSSFNNPNYGNEGRTQHEDHHVAFQSPFNIPIYGNEVRTQQEHHNPYQSAFNTPNYGNEGRTQHEDHHIAYQSPLYGNEVRTQQEDHHNPYQSAFNTPNYGNEGRTQQSPFYGF